MLKIKKNNHRKFKSYVYIFFCAGIFKKGQTQKKIPSGVEMKN